MRISDWSSDVCSSDLILADELADGYLAMRLADAQTGPSALSLAPPAYPMDAVRGGVEATVTVTVDVNADRKSVVEGRSVSVRVDLGGRRIIKKKKKDQKTKAHNVQV